MQPLLIEVTLNSLPRSPLKLRYDSTESSRPLKLVGVNGGTLAFDLWAIGLRHSELTGVTTKADFVNGLIDEYPHAGRRQQELGHVLEHWTWVRIDPLQDRTVPGVLVIVDEDRNVLFTDAIRTEEVLPR